MRIIAGEFKGRAIKAPKGSGTRPTTDRVRESLFSILQNLIEDARILDVFAGSGALSLEAVSRGAEQAVLIEKDWDSLDIIKENINKLGCGDRIQVIDGDALKVLYTLPSQSFDLIFLDPPYGMDIEYTVIDIMIEKELIDENSIIILEHDKKHKPDMDSRPLRMVKSKTYGGTTLSFYRKKEEIKA